MARWAGGGRERLQHAAMGLFHDRGYDAVTVAEIADAAGLTKRSFFNHFADKREVVFAGAEALEAEVVRRLADRDARSAPFDAAVAALAEAGSGLGAVIEFAAMRRALIDSSAELHERDLGKRASLAAAITTVLREQGVPPGRAELAGAAATAVFDVGYTAWGADPSADLAELMRALAGEMRAAVSPEERPSP